MRKNDITFLSLKSRFFFSLKRSSKLCRALIIWLDSLRSNFGPVIALFLLRNLYDKKEEQILVRIDRYYWKASESGAMSVRHF